MRPFHAVTVALVVVLAGCTPAAPVPSPTPTTAAPKPTPMPTPTPTVAVASLTIPACDVLLPIATARDLFSDSTELLAENPASEFSGRLMVPSITTVLSTASPTRSCFWGIPSSDGLFQVVVIGITTAEVATLQGELAAAAYAQTTMGTVTAFELEGMNEVGSVGTTHLFTGTTWILVDGSSSSFSGAVAGQVLDALRTANPTLGL